MDKQHTIAEGRLKFSDDLENLGMQDTEMGGVGQIRASQTKDHPVHPSKINRGLRGAGSAGEMHLNPIYPARLRLMQLEECIEIPDEEDEPVGPLKSGANSEPVTKRSVSGKKRKVDNSDHFGESLHIRRCPEAFHILWFQWQPFLFCRRKLTNYGIR